MKLSTRARYGVRLMIDLALNYGQGPVLLKNIARRQDISEKYLGQLIIPLKTRGLVNSLRGAHGGYQLAKPPAKISLKEIVEALEGDVNVVECVKKPDVCDRVASCISRNIWRDLNEKISQILKSQTLADLIKSVSAKKLKIIYNI